MTQRPRASARKADGDAKAANWRLPPRRGWTRNAKSSRRIEAAKRAGGNARKLPVWTTTLTGLTPVWKPAPPSSVSIPSAHLWCRCTIKVFDARWRYGNRVLAPGFRSTASPATWPFCALYSATSSHIQSKHAAEFRCPLCRQRLLTTLTYRRCAADERWKAENHELFTWLRNPDEWKSCMKAPSATPPPISCG